jgi:hypothetical protein
LVSIFPGILKGCIGVAAVKEFHIEESKDSMKESQSCSDKAKINSYKMLNVMDHTSHSFTFGFAWAEMIERSLPVAHYICLKMMIFLLINGFLQIVHLMVMAGSCAHTKILETIQSKFVTT